MELADKVLGTGAVLISLSLLMTLIGGLLDAPTWWWVVTAVLGLGAVGLVIASIWIT